VWGRLEEGRRERELADVVFEPLVLQEPAAKSSHSISAYPGEKRFHEIID
jgi:hypothetical protein